MTLLLDDHDPALVRPGLYLSSARVEADEALLKRHGVTHVLQVGVELSPSHPGAFEYLSLPVWDMPEQDIVGELPRAFAFLDAALGGGGAALVHCAAGVSRSATVVIAHVMRTERLSADAATAVVAAARPVVWPNGGFRCQLRQFEALGCDASRWRGGWSMQRYLSEQYGDEGAGFMAAMLGGAPADRLRGGGGGGASGGGSGTSGAAAVHTPPPLPPPPAAALAAAARQQRSGGGSGGGGGVATTLPPRQPQQEAEGGSDTAAQLQPCAAADKQQTAPPRRRSPRKARQQQQPQQQPQAMAAAALAAAGIAALEVGATRQAAAATAASSSSTKASSTKEAALLMAG